MQELGFRVFVFDVGIGVLGSRVYVTSYLKPRGTLPKGTLMLTDLMLHTFRAPTVQKQGFHSNYDVHSGTYDCRMNRMMIPCSSFQAATFMRAPRH